MLLPAFTGSGASVLEIVKAGEDETVVVMAAPAAGVVSLESMLNAPLVMTVPFASGEVTCTTSCTEPDPPTARAPMFQLTTPAASVTSSNDAATAEISALAPLAALPISFAVPVFEYDSV